MIIKYLKFQNGIKDLCFKFYLLVKIAKEQNKTMNPYDYAGFDKAGQKVKTKTGHN